MSDRDDELLDAFLDDLAAAPVPAGLAGRVAQRVRHERQQRGRGIRAWATLAAAAVAVVVIGSLGLLVASPKSAPSAASLLPTTSSSPTAPVSASPTALASGVLPPPEWQPTIAPTVPPTLPPDAFATQPTWRVNVTAPDARVPSVALVVDPAGRVVFASPAAPRTLPAAFRSGVLAGSTGDAIDVYWPGTTCDGWATVSLDAAGHALTVTRTPVPIVCAPTSVEYGLELRFGQPVDASTFTVTMRDDARYTDDPMVAAFAFPSTTEGLAAMVNGISMAASTSDGGTTWHLTSVAQGWATGLARGDADWMAISCDPTSWDHCASGVYRRAAGGAAWVRVLAVEPGPLAASGPNVAVVEQPLEDHATGTLPAATGVRWSTDSGATWTSVPNPCPSATPLLSTVAFDGATLLVACEGQAQGGAADKSLLFFDPPGSDGGAVTLRPARLVWLPRAGTGARLSTAVDPTTGLASLQHAFAWAKGSALYETTDGGATWKARTGVADGDVRTVQAAEAWAGGGGMVLVYDRDVGAQILIALGGDGTSQQDVSEFLDKPCCGG